jgi:succinyl-diaminopimelate desuccinylase
MAADKEIVELTKKLMRFRTTSDNPNELERCMDFIEGYFSDHDVKITRFEKNKKPSLVISLGKTTRPELFLAGHIDVVPAADRLFVPKQKNGRLYGRGAYDTKSSVALMIVLMKQFSLLDEMPDIALMITSDEETGGKDGAKYVLQKYSSSFAIILDGGKDYEIITTEKGALHLKLTAQGKNAHGSTPWEGDNAIDTLIGFYARLRKKFPKTPKSDRVWVNTLSIGTFNGGHAINQVPEHAEMGLDMRFVGERERDKILRFVSKAKGIDVEIASGAQFLSTSPKNRYVQKLQWSAQKILGRKGKLGKEEGASDARYFADKHIPSVLLWPLGHHAHAEKEYVEIKSLGRLYLILQHYISNSIRKL